MAIHKIKRRTERGAAFTWCGKALHCVGGKGTWELRPDPGFDN